MIQNVNQITSNQTAINQSKRTETTITPFEKVLEKSVPKVTVKTADSQAECSVEVPSSLKEIFKRASDTYDVPYNFLVAVAKAESDFNPKATSKSGAQGIMQLMPATAKSLGVTDAYDIEQNIMGGAKYLAAHLKSFDGDTSLAAAAYNAGGAAVRKYNGVPPYSETQNYVKLIQKYMKENISVPNQAISTKKSETTPVEEAVAATTEEMANSIVVVGSGDDMVTMTYGAYLRYLELGTTGVG